MPIFYECQRCTACCRWPGLVKLSEAEIGRMAEHLELSEVEFIQGYTELNPTRTALILRNQPNGACVLLNGDDCNVNPVKPQQCRDFPNLWNFPDFQKVCHAKPLQVTDKEFQVRVGNATGRV